MQPAPAPPASGNLAAGRWAVQVGVFYGANSAESVRAALKQDVVSFRR